MSKYSKQTNDAVAKALTDIKLREIDFDTENFIIQQLLGAKGIQGPKEWTKKEFRPTARFEHVYWVMKIICPEVKTWSITGTEEDQIFEAYIEDKKFSVKGPTPPRTFLLAIWNYVNLKDEKIEKVEKV